MNIIKETISYEKTGYFSQLVIDYLEGKDSLKPFYKYPFELKSFAQAIRDKQKQKADRTLLSKVLLQQYDSYTVSENEEVFKNIESLKSERTFVVVTAHQPNLFLGPLYLLYKIISSVNLSERLNKEFPDNHFVPVYWMGSEDHDTDELNHVHLFGKTLEWNSEVHGAFGRRSTETLKPILDELKTILGESEQAKSLMQLLEKSYKNETTIAAATRRMLHELFGQYGLIVLDGDNPEFKKSFSSIVKEELFGNRVQKIVEQTNEQLEKSYPIQAKPRDINLFYLNNESRNRFVKEGEEWKVLNTDVTFSSSQLEKELETHPERFSPNVILRPLYQEMILPSVAFIGGGAEVAYFMELKPAFEKFNLNFPVVVLRNSVLWVDANQHKKWSHIGFDSSRIFENTDSLVNEFVLTMSSSSIDTKEERKVVEKLIHELKLKAEKLDKSILPMIEAEHAHLNKFIETFENKLLKAEKKKHETSVQQIHSVKEKLFPNNSLQERYDNFIPYYLKNGQEFIDALKNNIDPLEKTFTILSES